MSLIKSLILYLLLFCLIFYACGNSSDKPPNQTRVESKNKIDESSKKSNIKLIKDTSEVLSLTVKVVRTIQHNTDSYTQGLYINNGMIYESTGQYGESTIQEIDPSTGQVTRLEKVASRHFAEGIAHYKGKIYMLTWRSQKCLIYDSESFIIETELSYFGEGWGLTNYGDLFAMSDGSSQIKFILPENFQVQRTVTVTENGEQVKNLNELENIQGYIWANIWMSSEIVVFDPILGNVKARINLSPLYKYLENDKADVLNGIAFDEASGKIYLTGKYWDKIFEVELVEE